MTCENIQSLIVKFLKNELEGSEADEITKHLAMCMECRFVYQEMRQELGNSGNHSLLQ